MEKKRFFIDQYQEQAITQDQNCIVTAGAGSGKTTILARRFLRLIIEGKGDVESILTLTFTRKAAAEMHDRIYRFLIEEAPGNPRAAQAAAMFDKAQISTIDSFCSQIVRGKAGSYGISPDFTTDEETIVSLIKDTALDFVLRHSKNSELGEFAGANGFNRIIDDCLVPIGFENFLIARPLDLEKMWNKQKQLLFTELRKIRKKFSDYLTIINNIDHPGKTLKTCLNCFDLFPAGDSKEEWSVFMNEIGSIHKPPGKKTEAMSLLADTIQDMRNDAQIHKKITKTLELETFIRGFNNLMGKYQQEIIDKKIENSLLSFQDVMILAIEILKNFPEERRYYGTKYSHIMIDEFQDNNELQRDLLYLLAANNDFSDSAVPAIEFIVPEKLFFVGDEKQSIYRFRGADVSVFKGLSNELTAAGGKHLVLKKNYRSEPALIDFYNQIFEPIMSPGTESYEAVFTPMESVETPRKNEPRVLVFYKSKPEKEEILPDEDYLNSTEAEAFHIASFIKKSVENSELTVKEKGSASRPAQYKDFAVLMRSMGNQIIYERIFRNFSIPYTVKNARSLFQEAPVNDIYNFLQLCVYPDDRSAYAAVLRSPLVNVSDSTMVNLLLSPGPLFNTDGNSSCDLAKLRNAADMYREIKQSIDIKSPGEIIFEIWYRYGYRYSLLSDPKYHPYLDYYRFFKAFAEKYNDISMVTFLDKIRDRLGKYGKADEIEVTPEHIAGVQIMSIHASKGLEFPVVIAADLGNTGKSNTQGSNPYYFSDRYGLSFNFSNSVGSTLGKYNIFYDWGKEEEILKEEAELKRLLYVAATRAESYLVLSCSEKKRNAGISHLGLLKTGLGIRPDASIDPAGLLKGLYKIQEISEIPKDRLYHVPRLKAADTEKIKGYYKKPKAPTHFPKKEFSATELNTLWNKKSETTCTGIIEKLPEISIDRLKDAEYPENLHNTLGSIVHLHLEHSIRKGAVSELSLRDLPGSLRNSIEDSLVLEMLQISRESTLKFIQGPIGEELKKADWVEPELSFLYQPANLRVFISGIIDLVYLKNGTINIIDFKTDRIKNPAEYRIQLGIYRLAAEELYNEEKKTGTEIKTALYYLRDHSLTLVPPDAGILKKVKTIITPQAPQEYL